MAMKAQDFLDQVKLMCEIIRISVNVRKLALDKRTRETLELTKVIFLQSYETFDETHQKLIEVDPELSYGDEKAPSDFRNISTLTSTLLIGNFKRSRTPKRMWHLEKDNWSIYSDYSTSTAKYSAELAAVARVFNIEIDGLKTKIQQILADVDAEK